MRATHVLTSLLAAGCATYTARPLETGGVAERYHARRLDDSVVVSALTSLGAPTRPAAWHDWQLAEAAWVLRPERARLQAAIHVADAARVAAGARPMPDVMSETEYSFSGTTGESRWGFALGTLLTVELGGKRGARLHRANAGLLVAMAAADEEAWEVRWRVRAAMGERGRAGDMWMASADELSLADSILVLLRARYVEGAISRTELARMEADRQQAVMEVAARKRELDASQASLAERIGIPLAELERLTLAPDTVAHCADSTTRDSLEQAALGARRDLRRALAEYLRAEGDLRVEVANSWPNLALGPGLFFDHGVGKWTVAFGLPSLPLNRNRGPIQEAEARRELAARHVAEVQEQVLGEVTLALSACRSSAAEIEAIDISASREQVRLAEGGYQRGEVGRLEVMFARLEFARAARRLVEAGNRLRAAGVDLEHAMGIWTGSPVARGEMGGS